MTRKNMLIAVAVVLVGAAVVAANLYFKRDKGLTVTTESIKTRDLEAIVSASGQDPAEAAGQHQRRHAGPRRRPRRQRRRPGHEGPVPAADRPEVAAHARRQRQRRVAQAAEGSLDQLRQAVETARVQLEQAQQNLTRQHDLWAQQLTTREALEKAENDVQTARVGAAGAREAGRRSQAAASRRSGPALESARYDLSKVRIESPIDGIVTRRNIQEGETAVIGTMNNAGTVLLTLADMSVIQAEVEVDETNIPNVQLGQLAKITIDAHARPDVQGPRHRDRQQPDSGGGRRRPRRRRPTSRWS